MSENRARISRSGQSNIKQTAFNNLALSVEHGQSLSEVSSFTESIRSHHDGLQVSVVSRSSAAEVSFDMYGGIQCIVYTVSVKLVTEVW